MHLTSNPNWETTIRAPSINIQLQDTGSTPVEGRGTSGVIRAGWVIACERLQAQTLDEYLPRAWAPGCREPCVTKACPCQGPKRPLKHQDPTKYGFWNSPHHARTGQGMVAPRQSGTRKRSSVPYIGGPCAPKPSPEPPNPGP